VRAFEWTERDGAIFIRYTDLTLPVRDSDGRLLDRRRTVPLGVDSVRTARGTLDPGRVAKAEKLANAAQGRLLNGLPLSEEPVAKIASHETILGGFVLALDLESKQGLYAVKSRRYEEMATIRDRLFGLSRAARGRRALRAKHRGPFLDRRMRWTDWNVLAAQGLWRQFAEEFAAHGTFGVRRAEVFIDAIASVASWLRRTGRLDAHEGLLPKDWRQQLRDEWARMTSQPPRATKPRHTPAELLRLHNALDPAFTDPRMDLYRALGIHDVARSWRSQFVRESGTTFIRLAPRGRRRESILRPLLPSQAADLDEAMRSGYLADLEQAFSNGRLADYPIMPAALTVNGRVPVTNDLQPLSSPFADPRLELAFDLAAEFRLGQGLRIRRSDLLHKATAWASEIGAEKVDDATHVRIPGNRRKPGAVAALSPEQRQRLSRILSDGYLSECEAAYHRGELRDYPLIPAGRLVRGKAWPSSDAQPWTRAAAGEAFHEFEIIAGVQPLKGRGWYGIRRITTDAAREFTSDEAVLDAIGGWQDSRTRRSIYEDMENERVRQAAMQVRRKTRAAGRLAHGELVHVLPIGGRIHNGGRDAGGQPHPGGTCSSRHPDVVR
jgi:hypothetical protein